MTQETAVAAVGMTANQMFVIALVGLFVTVITPVVTAVILYIKQRGERMLVVAAVKASEASAKADRDTVVQTVKASTDLVQVTTERSNKVLEVLKAGQDEIHVSVDGNFSKLVDRVAQLESAMKSAGVVIPANSPSATKTLPEVLKEKGTPANDILTLKVQEAPEQKPE